MKIDYDRVLVCVGVFLAAVWAWTLIADSVGRKVLWVHHTEHTYEARGYINLCRSEGVAEVESHDDGTHTITCTEGYQDDR